MATIADARERLQPALLDRLIDDTPSEREEGEDRRVMSKAALRQAVLRDLGWLFNAVQPLSRAELSRYAHVGNSVLNYGLPALAGQAASTVDITVLERHIRQAIIDFEPRIVAASLTVKAVEADDVLATHNIVEFKIEGLLWAQPVPLEVLLRTKVDLELGKVDVDDLSRGAPASGTRS
jgi:type VI secretion system protein ImpF